MCGNHAAERCHVANGAPNPPTHLCLYCKRGIHAICSYQPTEEELRAHAPEAPREGFGALSICHICYQVRQTTHPLDSARALRESSESDCMEIDSGSNASSADEYGTGSRVTFPATTNVSIASKNSRLLRLWWGTEEKKFSSHHPHTEDRLLGRGTGKPG